MIKLFPDPADRSTTGGGHAEKDVVYRLARWVGALVVAGLLGGTVVRARGSSLPAGGRISEPTRNVTAPAGRRATVSLPDGSKVMLGPGSTLSYPAEFNRRREVRLDGEAYFEVTAKPRQPFLVRLGQLVRDESGVGRWRNPLQQDRSASSDRDADSAIFVRAGDLVPQGIRSDFVVRAYPEDRYPRVAVRAGQVTIANQVISAGQLGWLSTGRLPEVQPADTASWFAWTHGTLVFTSAFREVLPRLSRWYNLDLRLADSASGDAILVAALPDSFRADGLDAVALALGLRIERHGRVVTFYPDFTRRPHRVY